MTSEATPLGAGWLQQRLDELGVPRRGARLCVAYSGGADSMALLCALSALRRFRRCTLRALHVNHHLHADADAWAHRALQNARRLRIRATVLDVRVAPGGSTEAQARMARYGALRAALQRDEYLLTAHHQDDQLETVLLQLLRGAGVAGLAAMPHRMRFGAGWLLRPLLGLPRNVLIEFARRHGLRWSDDPSNDDARFRSQFSAVACAAGLTATLARCGAHRGAQRRTLR